MKPAPPKINRNPAQDLKTFEQLPAKTKELEMIKDQAEKTTGRERLELDRKIGTKGIPHPPAS